MNTKKGNIPKASSKKELVNKRENFFYNLVHLPDYKFITFNNLQKFEKLKLIIIILLTVMCCFMTRISTARALDVDNDEAEYTTGVGFQYAEYMREGKIGSILKCRENYEHPPLVKLIYGFAIAVSGKNKSPEEVIMVCRFTSVVFACLGTLLLFLISPWAALIFSLHTLQIYYSSKGWLDCITAFFTIAAFFCFIKANKKWNKMMIASAIFLGAGIASKYANGIFSIVIFLFLLAFFKQSPKYIFYYIGISLASFFIFDPAIWLNPFVYFKQSVFFHQVQSSGSALFQEYLGRYGGNTGLFGQFATLWRNKFIYQEHELMFAFDRVIFILGLLGLPFLFRRCFILFTWYIVGVMFLLFYPIKYPQYTLVFLPVLAISSAEFLRGGMPWVLSRLGKKITWPGFINEINLVGIGALVIIIYSSNFTYQHRNNKMDASKAYNSYAYTLTNLGRTEEAKTIFEKSASSGGELNIAAHLNIAKILLDQKNYVGAQAELMQVFQLDPDSPEGHIMLGNIFLTEQKNDKALSEYLKVKTDKVIDPNTLKSLWLNLGSVYLNKKEYNLSIAMLLKVINISPENGEAHYILGLAYFMQSDIALSGKEFQLAIKNGIENADVYHNLGVVYANQKRYQDAINAWEKALKFDASREETKRYIENAKRLL